MCTNKRLIFNPYISRHILVNCGHCPACLQEKALKRTNRINNNKKLDGSELPLFVTLTYSNDYVPFVRLSDILSSERYSLDFDSKSMAYDVPLFRKSSIRHYKGSRIVRTGLEQIDTLTLDDFFKPNGVKFLRGQSEKNIGICYYPDLQNFIKRLRINLQRNGICNNFSFYACSEYGPTTSRPHFHLLIQSSVKNLELWKCAISEAWPFDSGHALRNSVQIARDGAAYVSSYVNSDTSLSLFYKQSAIRPKHSYSKGFGFGQDVFSLDSIIQKIERGDLHYDCEQFRAGVTTCAPLLTPRYVISRYFPKFLGYSRFNDNTIFTICERPETYSRYGRITGATIEQIHTVKTSLTNAAKRFSNSTEFAYYFARAWSLYNSSLLIDNLANIDSYQSNIYAYDNIKQYFDGMVQSRSLDSICSYLDFTVPLDPNQFPKEQSKTHNLLSAYSSYSKDRKVRNFIYSKSLNI